MNIGKSLVIPTSRAIDLVRRRDTLSEDEMALLVVWCFHYQPPKRLTIIVDTGYEYGFSKYGDRLGLVDYWGAAEDYLYLDADNGITYYGKRVAKGANSFSVTAIDSFLAEIDKKHRKCIDLLSLSH